MTTMARPSASGATRSRQRALTDAISSLRTRARRISLEGLFLTVGALCLPIGVIVIILGWYGAAHTGHIYEQNDYLISGGLLGLGIIFIGGFLYFGHWMTRQIRATETSGQQVLRALARLEEKGSSPAMAAGTGQLAGHGPVFVVTEHGTMAHLPNCPAVADKTVRIVDRSALAQHRPCSICMPAD